MSQSQQALETVKMLQIFTICESVLRITRIPMQTEAKNIMTFKAVGTQMVKAMTAISEAITGVDATNGKEKEKILGWNVFNSIETRGRDWNWQARVQKE